ncbi:Uncharacterised protein [Halioglobus japonicus]|nr:Uncharacterised protein [Halioglobus japonicus]
MSHSMTSVSRAWPALTATLLLLGLLNGCGPAHVVVEGKFPAPLIEPLPLTLGVWYGDDFANHEFFDESKSKHESSWIVSTGVAQVQIWDTLLNGMFTNVVHLKTQPTAGQPIANVDAVLIPHVEELQYAIPRHTQIKVYEIWMRYRFDLLSASGTPIAQWGMTSYGKTPTGFLQSDQEAVNLAAVMALRDAGANFATNFSRVPAVQDWLREKGVPISSEPQ